MAPGPQTTSQIVQVCSWWLVLLWKVPGGHDTQVPELVAEALLK
jgi:hypothetical protein